MKYFIANWKMNMSVSEIEQWFDYWKNISTQTHNANIVIAPSFLHLQLVQNKIAQNKGIELASQDVSIYEKGAHTGEVGTFQLKNYVKYSIVGHSERGEDAEIVLKKATNCLENGIIPIICFTDPQNIEKYYAENVILAWEDPQNISKDGVYNAKPIENIEKEVNFMKHKLPENGKILYGGSVNSENIKELKSINGLNGFLIGNASLDPQHFYKLITS